MARIQTQQSNAVDLAVIAVATEQEQQLQQAYQQLRGACLNHIKHGLEFGKLCYKLREQNRKQGHKGEGFEAVLKKLQIAKKTAYRWIAKYEERILLRVTRHEVDGKQDDAKKSSPSPKPDELVFKHQFATEYELKQWNADIKVLGGLNKVWPLFLAFVQDQAAKTRQAKTTTKRVQ